MSTSLTFVPDSPAAKELLAWWHGLEDDKAGRAMLRRCRAPGEVVFVRSYHDLLHRLEKLGLEPWPPKLAAVAGLAAHLRTHLPEPALPRQMARAQDGGGPRVSDLRFAALMATTDPDELFVKMRRVIDLLGRCADLVGLADAVYRWDRPQLRRRWAYEYYAESPRKAPGKEK